MRFGGGRRLPSGLAGEMPLSPGAQSGEPNSLCIWRMGS